MQVKYIEDPNDTQDIINNKLQIIVRVYKSLVKNGQLLTNVTEQDLDTFESLVTKSYDLKHM